MEELVVLGGDVVAEIEPVLEFDALELSFNHRGSRNNTLTIILFRTV